MSFLKSLSRDFSISATVAGLIVVLVGMTSSAVMVFQAAQSYGATPAEAGSWLGSLCVGMGVLAVWLSLHYKAPIVIAWSTPGSVLLIGGGGSFTIPQLIGAFLFSAFLVFLFGVTGWFAKIMDRISLSLTSALLAGVLLHFCIDGFSAFKLSPILVGTMFLAYLIGRRFWTRMTMVLVLVAGIGTATALGLFDFNQLSLGLTQFQWTRPEFSTAAIVSLGVPLFIVTMASQNLTGISVMRANRFHVPVSPILTSMGIMNLLTAFFGGFSINLAAITAAIAMGSEAHPNHEKRYVAAVVSGLGYIFIGIFAGSVTALFAAFPQAMIVAIAGFALLGTVSGALQKALADESEREAVFVTFVIAASGFSALGIGAAFWAILVGLGVQFFLKSQKTQSEKA